MKKVHFSLLAAGVCLLALTACAKKPAPATTQLPPEPPAQTGSTVLEAPASDLQAEAVGEATALQDAALQLEKILFEYDSYTLTAQSREILARNAEWLRQNPAARLTVEGHCDERGSDEYNLALGERRAEAVRKYLVTLGVAADRLSIISYGEERPAVAGHGEEAWAQNRRAEFM